MTTIINYIISLVPMALEEIQLKYGIIIRQLIAHGRMLHIKIFEDSPQQLIFSQTLVTVIMLLDQSNLEFLIT